MNQKKTDSKNCRNISQINTSKTNICIDNIKNNKFNKILLKKKNFISSGNDTILKTDINKSFSLLKTKKTPYITGESIKNKNKFLKNIQNYTSTSIKNIPNFTPNNVKFNNISSNIVDEKQSSKSSLSLEDLNNFPENNDDINCLFPEIGCAITNDEIPEFQSILSDILDEDINNIII